MASLVDRLTAPDNHPRVIEACVQLIEDEVGSKRGLTGAAIKTGYKVVKALKPGIIASAVETLLPEFARALQPIFDRVSSEGGSGDAFCDELTAKPSEAADALLTVTDTRADRAANATLKKVYARLRGSAKANVETAVPGLARTLRPFL